MRPKEFVLRTFITLKNPLSSARFEPVNRGSDGKITTRSATPTRFEVITAVSLKIKGLWDDAQCSLAGRDRRFGRFRRQYTASSPGDKNLHT